jgi:hypothetical protein
VKSEGVFYLKDEKRWLHKVFHIYDSVVFYGEELNGRVNAETNSLRLGDFYLRNINAQHVRPLDYVFLARLGDVAGRLYEILSGKFYGLRGKQSEWFISYHSLSNYELIIMNSEWKKVARNAGFFHLSLRIHHL